LNGESFSSQDVWLLSAGVAIEIVPEDTLRLLRTYVPSPHP
jgi:hypothetical protein